MKKLKFLGFSVLFLFFASLGTASQSLAAGFEAMEAGGHQGYHHATRVSLPSKVNFNLTKKLAINTYPAIASYRHVQDMAGYKVQNVAGHKAEINRKPIKLFTVYFHPQQNRNYRHGKNKKQKKEPDSLMFVSWE